MQFTFLAKFSFFDFIKITSLIFMKVVASKNLSNFKQLYRVYDFKNTPPNVLTKKKKKTKEQNYSKT